MKFLYLVLAPAIVLFGCSSNKTEVKQDLPQTSPTESTVYTQNTEYHFDGLLNEDDPRHPPTRLKFYEEENGKVNILEFGSFFGPTDRYIDLDDDMKPDKIEFVVDSKIAESRILEGDDIEVARRNFQGYLELIKREKTKQK